MTDRSPLMDVHRSLGATISEFWGRDMPARYGDPAAEAAAVHDGAALFDLSFRGVLEVTGRDRTRFLQGMVTNDIESLAPGRGCHAAVLTPKGRIRTDLWVYCEADRFRLEVDDDRRGLLRETLEKYVIAEDVRIADEAEPTGLLSLQGPAAAATITAALPGELPAAEYQRVERRTESGPVRITRRTDYGGTEGFEIRGTPPALEILWNRLREAGARPAGTDAFDVIRVEAGSPKAGIDMDETTLFPEMGLEGAVSDTKGCYIGQEVVARVRDRGHVNRCFTGFRLGDGDPPRAGDPLLAAGAAAGVLTSVVESAWSGGWIALGLVRRELAVPGRRLQARSGNRTIPAAVAALPFSPAAAPRNS